MEKFKSNAKLTVYQKKTLTRTNAKQLGFFETWQMTRLGKRDGKLGLPKMDDSSRWLSPQLQKDADAFKEFQAIVWARTEIETADAHIEAEKLIKETRRQKQALQDLLAAAPEAISPEEFKKRFAGEETLDEDIVQARRRSEYIKKNSGFFAKKQMLENFLEDAYARLSELTAEILEANGSTRLIAEKVRNHTSQRMDAYWYGVHKTHAKAELLPPVPSLYPEFDAEDVYLAQHSTADTGIVNMHKRIRDLKLEIDPEKNSNKEEAV